MVFAGAAILLATAFLAFNSWLAARQTSDIRDLVVSPIQSLAFQFMSAAASQPSTIPNEFQSPSPVPQSTLEKLQSKGGTQPALSAKGMPNWDIFLPLVFKRSDIPNTLPIVRLEIPRLKVSRAVVPLGVVEDGRGNLNWDTDRLFATRNRSDLVGHQVSSALPGQGGNVVLVGHNYDQGTFRWKGVFINIKSLQPGDEILVYTEGGQEYKYQVALVKQIAWRKHSEAELAKHLRFLGKTESKQLTLITCGGANTWPWPARIYVVAVPIK